MLEIDGLEAGYGKKQVLCGVSIKVNEGEIVALIGPNGAGKSTVLKVVSGLLKPWNGEVRFGGECTNGDGPVRNVSRGITFAPQGNRVFDELTVMENLEIGGFQMSKKDMKDRIERMFDIFPILKDRREQIAGRMSGGEQQMLAVARALIPEPRLLMLDEPSLGLAPNLMDSVFSKIVEINSDTGTAIFIVEQKVRKVLNVCHRVYSLKLGRVAFEGFPRDLSNDEALKDLFL